MFRGNFLSFSPNKISLSRWKKSENRFAIFNSVFITCVSNFIPLTFFISSFFRFFFFFSIAGDTAKYFWSSANQFIYTWYNSFVRLNFNSKLFFFLFPTERERGIFRIKATKETIQSRTRSYLFQSINSARSWNTVGINHVRADYVDERTCGRNQSSFRAAWNPAWAVAQFPGTAQKIWN